MADPTRPEPEHDRARRPEAQAALPALRPSQLLERAPDRVAAHAGAASPALDWLAAPPTHPEEMKAAYDVRLGPLRLAGGARMTPAAIIASGVCTGLILLGVAAVVRAGRR